MPMFKRLRITVLLYVLAFVATAEFLSERRSTDWDAPLWVDVYVVAGDGSASTREYLARLAPDEFAGVERFLAAEAHRYGVSVEQPFRLHVVAEYPERLPELGAAPSALATLLWSLRMRWLAARLQWRAPGPAGDIVVFAVFHEAMEAVALDRSLALRKGMIAVANLFASREARGANQMVLAHELLHTLGATDKYALATNEPLFPDGYAAPSARPRWPQAKAEIMAGRIPLDEHRSVIPDALGQVLIGAATSREIGWTRP
jgi:hypothetical protein